jgi:ATP-dependent helicase/DNAse subunit B
VFGAPVSPSALETYLACPFAFYLRHVLGLEVLDEPDDALSIEPRDLGSVVHEILQATYGAAVASDTPTVELAVAALDQAAAAAFERAEAHGVTGFPLAWRVQRHELLADLRHVVESDPCWHDGLPPVHCEWSFGGRAAAAADADVVPELVVGDRTVRFRGRVDRVDASADGRRVRLVDYKTGAGATEAERLDQGRDVQLAVYVLAALAAAERDPDTIAAEYRMVRRVAGFRVLPLDPDPDAVRAGLAATLAVVVAGIAAGLYPRWHDLRRCRFCDAADRCGVDRFAFAAKRHDPRLRDLLSFTQSRGRRKP